MNDLDSRETNTSTMARRRRVRPLHEAREVELSPEEAAGFHGNDEHLTIDNLNMGCELMFEIVMRMST